MDRAITYNSYLKVDELLALQQPRSSGPEHDELLFIVIHQVYELWFKEILHELDHVRRLLDGDDSARVPHTLKRILTILKVLVAQLDILETMTPLEFQSFRERLAQASGFQSDQFRQLEAVLGRRDPRTLERFAAGSRAHTALRARLSERSLWRSLLDYLAREGYALAEDVREAADGPAPVPSEQVQDVLIAVYRTDPKNAALCERLVDLDEGVQEWRYRHMKMVERTIGAKPGTGGSAGAGYLRSTLMQPVFPDLWAIRSRL